MKKINKFNFVLLEIAYSEAYNKLMAYKENDKKKSSPLKSILKINDKTHYYFLLSCYNNIMKRLQEKENNK